MFAHLLPYLGHAARWTWKNRRELMYLHDRFRGRHRNRRRGSRSYLRGYIHGQRVGQSRANFGYGRGRRTRV